MLLSKHMRKVQVVAAQAAAVTALHFCRDKRRRKIGSRYGCSTRVRQRRSVESIFLCLGDAYFRRAYRMSYDSFCRLSDKLKSEIEAAHEQAMKKRRKQRRRRNRARLGAIRKRLNNPPLPPVPNGKICTSIRLACALRYFCGGCPYDVMPMYGVSHTEVLESVWYVVEATNKVEEWFIVYPSDHNVQHNIAAEFKAVSSVDFGVCAGALDGILIWIHKPTLQESKITGIDQQKYFCGRKNKFGLNCQAVCDVRGRILDISITYGGASSDLLAFENSALYKRLQDGILAKDLVLFGDNAYLNTSFMATPYPNTHGGEKDNYNFYHSQLRIRIECAFGMLVKRWGLLRMAIPNGVSVKKTIALVNALAKLHNFCISETDGDRAGSTADEPLVEDLANMESDENGFVPMVRNSEIESVLDIAVDTPDDLVGGGEHFDDVPRECRRNNRTEQDMLPRAKLCMHVANLHAVRPHSNRHH